jgi:hypothetical protein
VSTARDAERAEFLTGGMRPHTCATCGTRVLVKKNSWQHTSIQWTTSPASTCPVFAAHAAAGRDTALLDTCEELTKSIDKSVRDGEFGVLDD